MCAHARGRIPEIFVQFLKFIFGRTSAFFAIFYWLYFKTLMEIGKGGEWLKSEERVCLGCTLKREGETESRKIFRRGILKVYPYPLSDRDILPRGVKKERVYLIPFVTRANVFLAVFAVLFGISVESFIFACDKDITQDKDKKD